MATLILINLVVGKELKYKQQQVPKRIVCE